MTKWREAGYAKLVQVDYVRYQFDNIVPACALGNLSFCEYKY